MLHTSTPLSRTREPGAVHPRLTPQDGQSRPRTPMPKLPLRARHFVLPLAVTLLAIPLHGQQKESDIAGFGPLNADKPDNVTIDEIIKRMGEQEARFEVALNDYTFTETVKMDTINDDNNRPDGEYMQVSQITFDDKNRRVEHVTMAPANTLQRVIMTENDLKDVAERLPFILTTKQLPDYKLTYLGKQKVDDLDTYVFSVEPKTLVKGRRYFQGKVWVDQQDMEIVLCNGLNVPQDTRKGHEDLSPPFTTYYQQVDGKYWFPTYTRAEGILHFAAQSGALSQDVHMKNTVTYKNYKRFRTSVTIHYDGEVLEDNTRKPQDNGKPKP
jgi:hypothetical protein